MSEKYCILCVDDDHIGLGLRSALLENEGYSVTAVGCPFMALEYDVSQFHLAILDFDMPALNGFQLLLRLWAAHASFPIVLLSGMSWELPNDMRISSQAASTKENRYIFCRIPYVPIWHRSPHMAKTRCGIKQ